MTTTKSKGVGKKTTGKTSKDIYPQAGDDWQASSDFDTLTRAHEIKSDKGRHKRALAHGRGKIKHMAGAMVAGAAGKGGTD